MIARLRELLDVASAMLRRELVVVAKSQLGEVFGAIAAQHAQLVDALGVLRLPTGLVPCPTCSTMQQPRDGHMAVHFARATDQRPCVGSWPARTAAA